MKNATPEMERYILPLRMDIKIKQQMSFIWIDFWIFFLASIGSSTSDAVFWYSRSSVIDLFRVVFFFAYFQGQVDKWESNCSASLIIKALYILPSILLTCPFWVSVEKCHMENVYNIISVTKRILIFSRRGN